MKIYCKEKKMEFSDLVDYINKLHDTIHAHVIEINLNAIYEIDNNSPNGRLYTVTAKIHKVFFDDKLRVIVINFFNDDDNSQSIVVINKLYSNYENVKRFISQFVEEE